MAKFEKQKIASIAKTENIRESKEYTGFQERGIKLGDKWYNLISRDKSALEEVKYQGTITAETGGKDGKFINLKDAVVGAPEKSGGGGNWKGKGGGGKFNEKGIKVGHAINNAVVIAVALGQADDFALIESAAGEILRLAVRVEEGYDEVLKGEGGLTSSGPSSSDPDDPFASDGGGGDDDFDDDAPF